jgi:hypothetical protein
MFGKLLSLYKEPIPLFLTDHLYSDNPLGLVDIIQQAVISQAQFPLRYGIWPKRFDPSCSLARLVAQVNFQTIQDNPSRVSTEPSQIGLGTRSDVYLEWLGHASAPGCGPSAKALYPHGGQVITPHRLQTARPMESTIAGFLFAFWFCRRYAAENVRVKRPLLPKKVP